MTVYYTALELARRRDWNGHVAVLAGSAEQYSRGIIRWYAASLARGGKSVLLMANDRGVYKQRYVAANARLELIK